MSDEGKPKILIVDDQKNNLILLEHIISSLDVKIYTTTSPYEALEILDKEDFALIVSDVQMPGMSGFQMLEKIREKEENQYIPVIFISAIYTHDEHILKGIKTGAIDFIAKPFNHEIFLGKIEALLQIYLQKKKLESLITILNDLNKEILEKTKIIEKITQNTKDAIFLLDKNQKIIFYNKTAISIFELQETNLDNNKNYLKKFFVDRDFLETSLSCFGKIEEKTITKETECITTSNKVFPAEVTISCFDIDEQIHYLITINDITERKINEKKLLKSKEIKETNKVMSEFIDKINHELNTPINSIKGILKNLLLEKYNDNQKNDLYQSLQLAFEKIKDLENLIKNILQFKEKYILIKKEIQISKIIDELNEFCDEFKLNKKNIYFNIEYDKELQEKIIYTNENKLLYTIFNIIELLTTNIESDYPVLNIKFYDDSKNLILTFKPNYNNETLKNFSENLKNIENIFIEPFEATFSLTKQNVEALKGELIFDKNENKILLKLPFE